MLAVANELEALGQVLGSAAQRLARASAKLRSIIEKEPDEKTVEEDIVPPESLNEAFGLMDRIVYLLAANPGFEYSAADILELLRGTNVNSVRSAFMRLVRDGRIEQTKRGWYSIATTRR